MDEEQVKQFVKEAMIRHRQRMYAKAKKMLGVAPKDCTHQTTRIVTVPESEGRNGQAIDSMQVLSCVGCSRPLGVL